LGLSSPDFRMRDVELLIRFLAFRFRAQFYRGNLKLFLDDTCDYFNKNWGVLEKRVVAECAQFEQAILTATQVFGEKKAFRKYTKGSYQSRLNRAVFDVMSYAFAEPTVRKQLKNGAKSAKLRLAFEILCEDPRFRKSIESTTKSLDATKTRFHRFLAAVTKTTGQSVQFNLN
jgi:hypothetical protein